VALEDSLKSWAKAPGQTELEKCNNAETAIRKAIKASPALANREIKVSAQGSYYNRTNVREDSDVDVYVRCSDSLFSDVPEGMSYSDFGLKSPSAYPYSQFKRDVNSALEDYFGAEHVTPGKKAFDIKENTYRIAADVLPCFEHRRYYADGTWLTGIGFIPDKGSRIINFPDDHYANGVSKNTDTGGRFKDVVRILKRLRNKMNDEGIAAAAPIPSYLIEGLVWNAPPDAFGHDTYTAEVRSVLANLFNDTLNRDTCSEWGEVSELLYLFSPGQPWTLTQAHDFISAGWDYLGFE
jgi:hypothetical protein